MVRVVKWHNHDFTSRSIYEKKFLFCRLYVVGLVWCDDDDDDATTHAGTLACL